MSSISEERSLCRRGTCRICFEQGRDLIAPCWCAGTSKWIHRSCLDRWRSTGSNPRAMTNCPNCGFQYHLVQKECHTKVHERQQRLLRNLARQSLGWLVGTQMVIFVLALAIRLVDTSEHLVDFWNFAQAPGQSDPGDTWNALRHHKLTYYVSGLMLLLMLLGLAALLVMCSHASRVQSEISSCCDTFCRGQNCQGQHCCDDSCRYLDCYLCCDDCGYFCQDCCTSLGECNCSNCPVNADCCGNCLGGGGGGGEDLCAALVAMVFVFLMMLVFIGIFAVIVALVVGAQKFCQRWARIEQLRDLTREFIVQDLADPADLGSSDEEAPGQESMRQPHLPQNPAGQAHLQQEISRNLNEILGATAPRPPPMWQSAGSRRNEEHSNTGV